MARISNCQLAFSIARAARVPCLLADLGIDADSDRVKTYCERVSARDGRVVRDILDLSLRDLERLAIAMDKYAAAAPAAPMVVQQPGWVIPGCTDSPQQPKASKGKRLRAPGQ